LFSLYRRGTEGATARVAVMLFLRIVL